MAFVALVVVLDMQRRGQAVLSANRFSAEEELMKFLL